MNMAKKSPQFSFGHEQHKMIVDNTAHGRRCKRGPHQFKRDLSLCSLLFLAVLLEFGDVHLYFPDGEF